MIAEDQLSALAQRPLDYALFLDIDGTLIDLAETPEGITVPPNLSQTLLAVSDRMGGALALVTGRRIAWADETFAHAFPIAGLHGFERRRADGNILAVDVPEGLDLARARLSPFKDQPGILVEDKGSAIGLHYRGDPARQSEVQAVMTALHADMGTAWELQHGKFVLELRPTGATKGAAVDAFLTESPFAGRRPIAIGDDVTDETMFPVADAAGGLSIRIGDPAQPTAAQAHLPSPSALRTALERIASWGV